MGGASCGLLFTQLWPQQLPVIRAKILPRDLALSLLLDRHTNGHSEQQRIAASDFPYIPFCRAASGKEGQSFRLVEGFDECKQFVHAAHITKR